MLAFKTKDCIAAKSPAQYFIEHTSKGAESTVASVLASATKSDVLQLAKSLSRCTPREFESLTENLLPLRSQVRLKDSISVIDTHLGAAMLVMNLSQVNAPHVLIKRLAEDMHRQYDYLITELDTDKAAGIVLNVQKKCTLSEQIVSALIVNQLFAESPICVQLNSLISKFSKEDAEHGIDEIYKECNSKDREAIFKSINALFVDSPLTDAVSEASAKHSLTQEITSWVSAKTASIQLSAASLYQQSMFASKEDQEEPVEERETNKPITEYR